MDGLTNEQLEELRAALEALGHELRLQVEQIEEGAKPVDLGEPIGRLSRMEALQQQQMAEANRRAARLRLDMVERARVALQDGIYGVCLLCDEPIAFARLRAKPEVAVCIRCQSERERTQ
jgi:DnaK suppressor protein